MDPLRSLSLYRPFVMGIKTQRIEHVILHIFGLAWIWGWRRFRLGGATGEASAPLWMGKG